MIKQRVPLFHLPLLAAISIVLGCTIIIDGAVHNPFIIAARGRNGLGLNVPNRFDSKSSSSFASRRLLMKSRGGSSIVTADDDDNGDDVVQAKAEEVKANNDNEEKVVNASIQTDAPTSVDLDLSYDAEESQRNTNKAEAQQKEKDLDTERIIYTQWQRYKRLQQLSKKRRKNSIRSRRACLGLICSGVSLQTLSSQIPKNGGILAILGSLSIAATPMLQKVATKQKEMFVQTNSAMEEMAREIYLFRAGVAPYNHHTTKTSMEDFVYRGRDILKSVKDPLYPMTRYDGSEKPPPKLDFHTYTELRVIPMQEKYSRESRTYLRLSNFFSRIRDGCLGASSLIGFLCGAPAISAATRSIGVWSTVMTTLGTSIAHHLESQRFLELSQECSKAENDLETVMLFPNKDEYEAFVHSCEDVFASTAKSILNIRRNLDEKGEPKQLEKKEAKWNPDVICGDNESGFYPASARAQWLMENKDMNEEEAKAKVMREYPSMFLYEMD